MHKGIKKWLKISIIFIVVSSALSFGGYYLLITKPVQNIIGRRVLKGIAEQTNTKINATSVRFKDFKQLEIEGLYIEDQNNDTLLYAPKVVAVLDSLNRSRRSVSLKSIEVSAPVLRVSQNAESEFNFMFIVDSLANHDKPDSLKWNVAFHNISLEQGDVSLALKDQKALALTGLDVSTDINKKNIILKQLKFDLDNGFSLERSYAGIKMTSEGIEISELSLVSPHSAIILRDVAALSPNLPLKDANIEDLQFNLQSNNSYISGRDVSFFLPDSLAFENSLVIDGFVNGNLASLKGQDLHLRIDSLLDINSKFEVRNLNDMDSMSFDFELENLIIDVVASAQAYNELMPSKPFDVSPYAHWEELSLTGKVSGNKQIIKTEGVLESYYGSVDADVSITLFDNLKTIEYSGDITTRGFNVGKALQNSETLGRVSAQLFVTGGKQPSGEFGNYFKGEISSLSFMDYNYSNISLEGGVGKGYFNGNLNVADKNARFDFSGEVDFLSSEPAFNFELDMKHLAVAKLNLTEDYDQLDLSFILDSKLKGNHVDNVNGFLDLYNLEIATEHSTFDTDSIGFDFKPLDAMPSIVLTSDYANGLILGRYNFSELLGYFNVSMKKHLKTLPQVFSVPSAEVSNDFNFVFEIDNLHDLAETLDLPLRANGFSTLGGEIHSSSNIFNIEANIPYLLTSSQVLDSVSFTIDNNDQLFTSKINVANFTFGGGREMNNIVISSEILSDTMFFSAEWLNDGERYDGDYSAKAWLQPYGRTFKAVIETQPSTFQIANAEWELNKNRVTILPQKISVENLVFKNNSDSYCLLDGTASDNLRDTMRFELNQFDLGKMSHFLNITNFDFDGVMSGQAELYSLLDEPIFVSDLSVDSAMVNASDWGNMTAMTSWDAETSELNLYIDCESSDRGDNILTIDGIYHKSNDSLVVAGDFDKFNLGFLVPYLELTLANFGGLASGHLDVRGSIKDPELYGALKVDDGEFRINYLSTDYFVNDTIKFDKGRFVFDGAMAQDQEGNYATVTGDVRHTRYKNMMVDIILESERFMGLNTTALENEYFYGDMYINGAITVKNTSTETLIGSRASTAPGSFLTVPLSPVSTAASNNFINYVVREKETVEEDKAPSLKLQIEPEQESIRTLIIDMNFNITPDAALRLEIDATSGNAIDAIGSGSLNVQFQKGQPFQMFGEYEIERGDYLLTLQQIFNKKFDINAGSSLRWSGRPGNAIMDITAQYPTRASLYNLMPDAISESNKNRRVPVNVQMFLTERLSKPGIAFDIELPNTDEETQQSVSSIINTEEEMSRQVLSLLIMNSFYTPDYYTDNSAGNQTNSQLSSVAAVTASEFLSNQLSSWMSQISDNVDLGFRYIPEQETTDAGLTPEEYEMAISTQFFNDRLTVNGNVGYQDYAAEARPPNVNSNFVGEVDVELKLNEQLKLKAYSHQNDDILYENSSMKQGAGITYEEDFTTVKELRGRYRKRIGNAFKRKDKRNEEAIKDEEDEIEEEAIEDGDVSD